MRLMANSEPPSCKLGLSGCDSHQTLQCRDGEIGRHVSFRSLWELNPVRVRLPLPAPKRFAVVAQGQRRLPIRRQLMVQIHPTAPKQ